MRELDDNDLESVRAGKTLAVAAAEGLGAATAFGVVVSMAALTRAALRG